jgi:hypothetical protein
MKYVSCTCQSNGNAATMIPVSPPIVNTEMSPSAKSIGVVKVTLPRQSVASQLMILTPVGTPTSTEAIMKNPLRKFGIPTANMWCAQTSIDTKAIPTVENAIAA